MLQEVAYIAYHFHWSRAEIMNMSHRERRRWTEEVARINRAINDASDPDRLA